MVETFKSQLDAERLGWLILLQTEIDGSCQTKVSVPVNTLKFQSFTTWHDYMLTKCKLDNQ